MSPAALLDAAHLHCLTIVVMNLTTITPIRLFGIHKHGSTISTEIRAGLTTFLAMAYIIVVNPAILEKAGINRDPGTIATIAAAVFGCLAMGFYANRPFAVAPYMGENAFIAFSLVPL